MSSDIIATTIWFLLQPGDVVEIALDDNGAHGFPNRFAGIVRHLRKGVLSATGWYPSIEDIKPIPELEFGWSSYSVPTIESEWSCSTPTIESEWSCSAPTIDGNLLSDKVLRVLVRHPHAREDLIEAVVNGQMRHERLARGEELH